ncbi:sugar kinase [Yoonia sp. R2-816]|uniref:sugar kinase n=1 Tax=Yoonia sp. R2-816 TaxID=3342638 RepID=UPI0037287E5B
MNTAPDIVALGEALIEFTRLPTEDGQRPIFRQGFGGDTSNAIIAAARQGARTGYLSAVGEDPFGDDLLALWDAEGVDTTAVRIRPQDPTGAYFVLPDPVGRKFSYARRGSAASLYGPSGLDEDMIASARILHVSALSQAISPTMRAAVTHAAKIARENGTLVPYDTNLRLNLWTLGEARQVIEDFLPLADIVLPSDDEATQLTGLTDDAAILDHFASFGARHVVLKRGSKGPVMRVGDQLVTFDVPRVEAVDSTGAGDSFAGAFLAYLLETGDAQTAVRAAMQVAAGTVSGFGAVDPIPYRADISIRE